MESLPLLVAVDFSPRSARAVEFAVRLARGSGRRVDLLHVALHSLPAHAQAHAPAGVREAIRKNEEVSALRELQRMQEAIPEALRGRLLLRRGRPAEVICQAAGEGYELVVLATQGRTGLAHVLIGSVAEQVVRQAPIPVLVVR